jgi:alkylhydroperoxidase family enzyme
VAVYVREAHPTDGWRLSGNDRIGISFLQPKTKGDRAAIAAQCCSTLEITMPMVVDEMNDPVGHLYSGMPDRLYIIDRDGYVAYKGGRGPFGFKTGEMEQSLLMLLLDQGKATKVPSTVARAIPVPGAGRAATAAHVPVLTDAEAWKVLPPVEEGFGQLLPVWVRALARSLPKTAAAMLELDYAQRVDNPLPPRLRAKLRWIAAHANRCNYAQAYALADYVRAGGPAADIDDLPRRMDKLPEAERLALQVVKQLAEAAYTVSDAQISRLVDLLGEKQVVAIVLVAAFSNFQDRLLLAQGVSVEPGGPLPPVKIRFRKPPPPAQGSAPKKDAPGDRKVKEPAKSTVTAKDGRGDQNAKDRPKRKLSPPAKNPPAVPEKVDDPEWVAVPFEALRERLSLQIARRQGRIRIPDWETVRNNLPDGVPRPDKPIRIIWSLVTVGYQPRLAVAWSGGLRAFRSESDLDAVFHESMFWVVTRSVRCFY